MTTRNAAPTPLPIPLTGDPQYDEVATLINTNPDPAGLCRSVLAELDGRRLLADVCNGYDVRLLQLEEGELPDIEGFHAMALRPVIGNQVIVVVQHGHTARRLAGIVAHLLDHLGVPA